MSTRRRRPAQRLDEPAVRAFLESKPGWAVLSTCGRDGYPHSVPLGYFMHEGDVILGTTQGTQKLCNVARDARVSVLIEKTEGGVLTGVMLQGDAEVVDDDEGRLVLQRSAARQRGVPEAELPTAARPGGAYIRVRARKVVSWHFD